MIPAASKAATRTENATKTATVPSVDVPETDTNGGHDIGTSRKSCQGSILVPGGGCSANC